MSKYVSRSFVLRNGTRLPDVKNAGCDEVTYREIVTTMTGSGTFETSKKYTFSFDQVIRKGAQHPDWSSVENEKWTIDFEGGFRVEFSGVSCLSEGEIKSDGEKETVQTIKMHGEVRSIR